MGCLPGEKTLRLDMIDDISAQERGVEGQRVFGVVILHLLRIILNEKGVRSSTSPLLYGDMLF
jgi:hypothetical protein